MVCSTLHNDKSLSVQRPEIWKRYCLKRDGMFDFAERQQLEECSGQKDGNATF